MQQLTAGIPRFVHRMVAGVLVKQLQLTPGNLHSSLRSLPLAINSNEQFQAELLPVRSPKLYQDFMTLHLMSMLNIPLGKPLNEEMPDGPHHRLWHSSACLPVMLSRREQPQPRAFGVHSAPYFARSLLLVMRTLGNDSGLLTGLLALPERDRNWQDKEQRVALTLLVRMQLLAAAGPTASLFDIMPFLAKCGGAHLADVTSPIKPDAQGRVIISNVDPQTRAPVAAAAEAAGVAELVQALKKKSKPANELYGLFSSLRQPAVILAEERSPTADILVWLPGDIGQPPGGQLVEVQVKFNADGSQKKFGRTELQREVRKSLCQSADNPGLLLVVAAQYADDLQVPPEGCVVLPPGAAISNLGAVPAGLTVVLAGTGMADRWFSLDGH